MVLPSFDDIVVVPIGAGLEIGRSCILLYVAGRCIMLDCGMHMGFDDVRRYPDFGSIASFNKHAISLDWKGNVTSNHTSKIPHMFDLTQSIDCALISHYHLDHTGALPFLYRSGYRGPILMSNPTKLVSQFLLADFQKVCFSAPGQDQKLDYFSPNDINQLYHSSDQIRTVRLSESVRIDDCIVVTPHYAGHVVGAVMWEIVVRVDPPDESSGGLASTKTIIYTGDYNVTSDSHLASAHLPPGVVPDVLISESTYATVVRESRRFTDLELMSRVLKAVQNGGKVLIPVFALGRAQELALVLHREWERMGLYGVVPLSLSSNLSNIGTLFYQLFTDWCQGECLPPPFTPLLSDHTLKSNSQRQLQHKTPPSQSYSHRQSPFHHLQSTSNFFSHLTGLKPSISVSQLNTVLSPLTTVTADLTSTNGVAKTAKRSRPNTHRRSRISARSNSIPSYLRLPSIRLIPSPFRTYPFLRPNPFLFPALTPYTKVLVARPGPCVLLASPGMLHTGISLYALSQWCDDPKNLVIIPGYCSPETVGGQLLAGKTRISVLASSLDIGKSTGRDVQGIKTASTVSKKTFIERHYNKNNRKSSSSTASRAMQEYVDLDIKCQVLKISFSAHADAHGILALTRQSQTKVLVLVHGTNQNMQVLASFIAGQLNIPSSAPANNVGVRIRDGQIIGDGFLSLSALRDELALNSGSGHHASASAGSHRHVSIPSTLNAVVPAKLWDIVDPSHCQVNNSNASSSHQIISPWGAETPFSTTVSSSFVVDPMMGCAKHALYPVQCASFPATSSSTFHFSSQAARDTMLDRGSLIAAPQQLQTPSTLLSPLSASPVSHLVLVTEESPIQPDSKQTASKQAVTNTLPQTQTVANRLVVPRELPKRCNVSLSATIPFTISLVQLASLFTPSELNYLIHIAHLSEPPSPFSFQLPDSLLLHEQKLLHPIEHHHPVLCSTLLRALTLSISTQYHAVWHLHSPQQQNIQRCGEESVFLCHTSLTLTTKGLWSAICLLLDLIRQSKKPLDISSLKSTESTKITIIMAYGYQDLQIGEQLQNCIETQAKHFGQMTKVESSPQ